jgi:hypothetical protein
MSYLQTPRLNFAGQFQADPSTVNNDPDHYNNATFKPNYQDYGPGGTNGWWNPDGTGSWRFVGIKIKSVTYMDGTSTGDPKVDPIIGLSIMDANTRVAGKIVDLDPYQQGVSALWGVKVRIVSEGNDIMAGDYEVASFTNLFLRSTDKRGIEGMSAKYTSIIKNITWNLALQSRYLQELHQCSPESLSINFNVDRYNGDRKESDFTLGRIVGSIGPHSANEPKHFVPGRQLAPNSAINGAPLNYATAVVNETNKTITIDMGNSLQFGAGEVVAEKRDLYLAVATDDATNPYSVISPILYESPDWYNDYAGITADPFVDPNYSEDLEPAHYYRFEEIVKGKMLTKTPTGYAYDGDLIPFDNSQIPNMKENPKMSDYPMDTQAYVNCKLFNYNYTSLLNALHITFNGHPGNLVSAIGLMFSLRLYAQKLLALPHPKFPGYMCGPSFEYVTDEDLNPAEMESIAANNKHSI